ncbi:response regulator [Inhella gelatinilytica]|uniref:Response regulator n=1 Tax=Inhella gelatinilytica TaxID=2795030 RepID=A0A931IWH2_9BURK|nr:response regulator [Inhella gelatinilytica]MBH9552285.1 response regulator [Inhella gelatinilytica]
MRLNHPYAELDALVIDDMATQQTTLRTQLHMVGIDRVDAVSSADDALRHIRGKRYHLILCDYNLNAKTDGQQLFEHLRENRLLPPDCLFFMVTAESHYSAVASASEQVPDAYLLKPITAGDIEERLRTQLEKRQALLPITKALGKQDWLAAVQAADEVLARKDRWFMHALQHKAQLQLQLGAVDEARGVYEQALQLRPGLLWAQVGLMRAHKAAGAFQQCRELALAVLQTPDGSRCLPAFDLLADAQERLGDTAAAVETLKQAVQAVPSARRQRLLGEAAYREGDLAVARQAYAKAYKGGQGSVMAQPQDALVLAQALVEQGEGKEALTLLTEAHARGTRGAAFDQVALAIKAQAWVQTGEAARGLAAANQALEMGGTRKGDFATLALARAALATGQDARALGLMQRALCADHEDLRTQRLVTRALTDHGKGEEAQALIASASQSLKTRLFEAKRLLRSGQLDEALVAIEAELADYPENTTVLLECTQMNCMWLRLNKCLEASRVDRVRDYLARLEKLLPGHERVAQMRRYLRETLATLSREGGFSISKELA